MPDGVKWFEYGVSYPENLYTERHTEQKGGSALPDGAARGTVKLISWNVNGLRACLKKGFTEAMAA